MGLDYSVKIQINPKYLKIDKKHDYVNYLLLILLIIVLIVFVITK
jgi:hypothetical protein